MTWLTALHADYPRQPDGLDIRAYTEQITPHCRTVAFTMNEQKNDIAEDITAEISAALEQDQLDLPSLPEVALRIRDEAESELVSAVSLAAVVGDDPALTTQLVKVANSPMFRATRSIDDLSQAISRLGVEYAANIVTGLAMRNMFQATTELVDKQLRRVWQTSMNVAAWSSMLTKRFTKLRPDQAMLAGLTHSIGVLPILTWVEENDHIVQDGLTLERVIETSHPIIGEMILRHWNFSDELACVPKDHLDPSRELPTPDYADVVCVALHANTLSQDQLAEEAWQDLPAYQRIGFGPDLDAADVQDILSEVDAVRGVLG